MDSHLMSSKLLISRLFLTLTLILNIVSYFSWGTTVLPRADISDYIRNHAVREIVCGLVLTLTLLTAIWRPIRKEWALSLVALSGGSVLGFWIGLVALGGIEAIDTIFAGQTPTLAYALHVPQLVFWLIGGFLLVKCARDPG
jgi:hypothetical protein